MKSIQTRIVLIITLIMIVVTFTLSFTATSRTNKILDEDSDRILSLTVDQNVRDLDAMLTSVEQSVGTIYNYAEKRAETYKDFLTNETQRKQFNYDVSELGKSIAEKTPGAMSVYLRYNPEEFGARDGFWYTINIEDGTWNSSEPTDMSLYDKDDLEHVGWYYIPVETGKPLWMDPYFNQNLGIDMISYIIPYYHDGHTVGVIGMDIDISILREFVEGIRLYDSGRAYLVSPKGDIIFHFDYPDGLSSKNLTDAIMPFINSVLQRPVKEIRIVTGIDGITRKVLTMRLRNGMVLGLDAPVNEINVPQRTLNRQLILISLLILVMAIAVCLAFIRTVIAPLKRMTQVAEHYANGDYSDIMNTDSHDEIGILSNALQTMSTSLKSQIEIADAANRSKSIFLANMSHEIRTPINAILGFDEMILRESEESITKDYAANIKNSGQTLLALINEILDFSKIESGKLEIVSVEYDMKTFLNDMLDMIEFRACEKKLTVKHDIDSSIPSKLYGDDIRMREIFTNLLTNAVKYTEEGSVTLSVKRVSSDDSKVRLLVSVKDTGKGIKEEDKAHLWDSFQRLDEKHNRGIEGTGLGLAITHKYIELMGSSLELESTYGQGSDFYFEVDQGIVDPEPIGDFNNTRRSFKRKVEVYKEGFKAPDAHILVVDDVELNLAVIKGLLKNSKIRIDTAMSGAEAIEKLHTYDYDLVFLDHMMPEMDGIETLEKIIADDDIDNDRIPIIALTANAISGAQKMYLEHGFVDYLSKPINPANLEKLLIKYLPHDKIKDNESSERDNKPGSVEIVASSDGLIDRDKGLEYFGGQEDLYNETLKTYAEEDFETSLENAFRSENWKGYETVVHALKSSSLTIGAVKLYEVAKAAELSLKVLDDSTFVKQKHGEIIDLLRAVIEEINRTVGKKDK